MNKLSPKLKKMLSIALFSFTVTFVGTFSYTYVKKTLETRKFVSYLSSIGATPAEIKDITQKAKDNKNNFEVLFNEKSFRTVILRYTVAQINKQTPIKIDEITRLTRANTDLDRSIFYKYDVIANYDDSKKMFNRYKETLYQNSKSYWCYDNRANELRKMKVKAVYEYFANNKFIGRYLVDVSKDC